MKSGEEKQEGQEAERILKVMILEAKQLVLVVSPGRGPEAELGEEEDPGDDKKFEEPSVLRT